MNFRRFSKKIEILISVWFLVLLLLPNNGHGWTCMNLPQEPHYSSSILSNLFYAHFNENLGSTIKKFDLNPGNNYTVNTYPVVINGVVLKGWIRVNFKFNSSAVLPVCSKEKWIKAQCNQLVVLQMNAEDENFQAVGEFSELPAQYCRGATAITKYQLMPCRGTPASEPLHPGSVLYVSPKQLTAVKDYVPRGTPPNLEANYYWKFSQYYCNKKKKIRFRIHASTIGTVNDRAYSENKSNPDGLYAPHYWVTINENFGVADPFPTNLDPKRKISCSSENVNDPRNTWFKVPSTVYSTDDFGSSEQLCGHQQPPATYLGRCTTNDIKDMLFGQTTVDNELVCSQNSKTEGYQHYDSYIAQRFYTWGLEKSSFQCCNSIEYQKFLAEMEQTIVPLTTTTTTTTTKKPTTTTTTKIPATTPKSATPTKIPTTTPKPGTPTKIPATTPKPGTPTKIPATTPKPGTPTKIPATTPKPGTPTEIPATTPKPGTPTKIPATTPKPGTPTKIPATQPTTKSVKSEITTEIPETTTGKPETSTKYVPTSEEFEEEARVGLLLWADSDDPWSTGGRIWRMRKFHGIFMSILTLFVFPVNFFMSRYYKETFMKIRVQYCMLWYFVHLIAVPVAGFFLTVGTYVSRKSSQVAGHSWHSVASEHRKMGWTVNIGFLILAITGGIRCFRDVARRITIGFHWIYGTALYILLLIIVMRSTRIPGTPSASFDRAHESAEVAAKAVIRNQSVEILVLIWISIDIIFHIIMSVALWKTDRHIELAHKRYYAGTPIPLISDLEIEDIPGSKFRKIALVVYITLSGLITVAVCVIIYRQSFKNRGFGSMKCTHDEGRHWRDIHSVDLHCGVSKTLLFG